MNRAERWDFGAATGRSIGEVVSGVNSGWRIAGGATDDKVGNRKSEIKSALVPKQRQGKECWIGNEW